MIAKKIQEIRESQRGTGPYAGGWREACDRILSHTTKLDAFFSHLRDMEKGLERDLSRNRKAKFRYYGLEIVQEILEEAEKLGILDKTERERVYLDDLE